MGKKSKNRGKSKRGGQQRRSPDTSYAENSTAGVPVDDRMEILQNALKLKANRDEFDKMSPKDYEQLSERDRGMAHQMMAQMTLMMAQCGLVDEEKHSSIVYAEEHKDELFSDGGEAFFKDWKEATEHTMLDKELFHPCPPRPECPICFLPLPEKQGICYQPCCGKTLCDGCIFAHRNTETALGEEIRCPFCRDPAATTDMERVKKTEERLKHGDSCAFYMLGGRYFEGMSPFKQNRKKGLELFNQAAELGSEAAHYALGMAHYYGEGVEKNEKKVFYHLRLAAIGGVLEARHFLGQAFLQGNPKNLKLAYKHFVIAAEAGHDKSLKEVKTGYSEGHVEKDVFGQVVRAHKAAKEEMKSEAREKAAKLYHRERGFIATNTVCK